MAVTSMSQSSVSNLKKFNSITTKSSIPVEYWVIGGGGAGSKYAAGGGGAGGISFGEISAPRGLNLAVEIGAGGAGATVNYEQNNGIDTTFDSIVSSGGGSGSGLITNGVDGGCGGGAGSGDISGPTGGQPDYMRGFRGGNSYRNSGLSGSSGGGGIGDIGGGSVQTDNGGAGGAGYTFYPIAAGVLLGGGGGGSSISVPGAGGSGIGGAGATSGTAGSGTANTGSGGGGSNTGTGGSGGSGVIILRVPESSSYITSGGVTASDVTESGKRIITITAAGSGDWIKIF